MKNVNKVGDEEMARPHCLATDQIHLHESTCVSDNHCSLHGLQGQA